MEMKQCEGCGAEKPLEAYPKRSGRSTRRGVCRACLRTRKKVNALHRQQAGEAAASAEDGLEQQLGGEAEQVSNERNESDSSSMTKGSGGEVPEAAPSKQKRKRKRKRGRGKKKASKAVSSAAADEQNINEPMLESAHEQTDSAEVGEQAQLLESGSALHQHEDEAVPAKKRKRKRKRGRGRKKAKLEAGVSGSELEQASLAAVSPDSLEAMESSDEPEAVASEEEQASESTIRPKKRKRRKRNKKQQVSTSALANEDDCEQPASALEREALLSDNAAESETADDSLDEAIEEEAAPRKRKRKRRRRKKKREEASGSEPQGEAEAKPIPVRPPDKRIVPFHGPFSYNAAILNDKGTGMIRLRGRRETGKRWHTEIEKDIAVRMVKEGAAGIVHPRLIHKLYTKSDFRLLVLQRDNYVCRYCGKYGDTIDHVMPKSKGGLSSPMNCVCACSECNLLKADKLDFPFPDDGEEFEDE
ncbi:HNH endonuclease [Paenibacillus curdlanolyticus YK9]|uniref:HNH endonuclease n=1 Tax=Paenibacillus curdlanolyticus YK9 TaxID=717606 RepID=E0IFV2_9BACL|nr:HNH endonuclease signature motif containing protein [Paenibacillus curdlanolyticus]EFM08663.1 HNH endonuclease [Paenibacillus curdlanolyticus YK9]